MIMSEIVEGFKTVWSRGPKGITRKYRCTDGPKKGRVVAKPITCTSGLNLRQSAKMKTTRRSKGLKQAVKRYLRFQHPTTIRLRGLNKPRPKYKRKARQ